MEINYDEKLCVKCGACVTECEWGGIFLERGKIVIDENRAEDWASIAEICPAGALKMSNKKSAPWTARGPSQVT